MRARAVDAFERVRPWVGDARVRDGAALVAGAVTILAFAPFYAWPLAVLGPALLFHLWRECARGRAAWRGWLFGVGFWGAGVYWVYFSLHLFGAAVAPLAGALTVAFAAGLALTLAILGALVAIPPPERRGWAWLALVVPGAWVLLEWVRSWLLTGFPWLLLGTSQVDTWLAGYAPVVGVYGIGLVVAVSAGIVAALPRWAWPARGVGVVAAVALWALGPALAGVGWTRPAAPVFDAAIVQGHFAQERKFDALDRALERYTGLTRELAGRAEIVLWPETAVPTVYAGVAERLNELGRTMAERGTHIVTGVFTRDRTGERFYNAVRPLGPGHDAYRKQHLVPFGEYVPLRDWLGFAARYIDVPMGDLAAGGPREPVLAVDRYRLGASVCYEAAYPGIIRSLAARSEVLVNVSNDAWFGDSTAPHQHLQIARLRTLETQRPMLRATNTGVSAIIDHRARLLARAPQFEVAVAEARVEARVGLTPYVRLGDWPALVAAAMLVIAPPAIRRWRRRGWPTGGRGPAHRRQ